MVDYSISFNPEDFPTVAEMEMLIPMVEEKPLSPKRAVICSYLGIGYLVSFDKTAPSLAGREPGKYIQSYRLPWGE